MFKLNCDCNCTFSALRRGPLSCVWIETGNPKQPLVRVWIDEEMRLFPNDEQTCAEETVPLCV